MSGVTGLVAGRCETAPASGPTRAGLVGGDIAVGRGIEQTARGPEELGPVSAIR